MEGFRSFSLTFLISILNWKVYRVFRVLGEFYFSKINDRTNIFFAYLSYLIRQKIEEIINKKLVFPNKISKRFTKSIEAAELKSIEAEVSIGSSYLCFFFKFIITGRVESSRIWSQRLGKEGCYRKIRSLCDIECWGSRIQNSSY